jgi:hypothetical protein
MNEKWKPLYETPTVSAYQDGDKTLILSEKEITFQTNEKIIKIKRLEKPPHNRYLP